MQQDSVISLAKQYRQMRYTNEAWRLLTARRAPLILACAERLFINSHDSVSMNDAIELLARCFDEFANDSDFDIHQKDTYVLAKTEWQTWLKRGLIVEKNQVVFATDALQKVISFIKTLDEATIMTSTASRLQTVQSEVQKVYSALNPNKADRENYLQAQIDQLQAELERVRQGDFQILSDTEAIEQIQNIYQLSTGLYVDFRRVEDSYRVMDQKLREDAIRDNFHRGDMLTGLLDSHEQLINTPEGRVFYNFNQALQRDTLDALKDHIRQIISYPITAQSLNARQLYEFSQLTYTLTREARRVNRAKQQIEHDVKNFVQSVQSSEHHRVGALLKQLFQYALAIDWQNRSTQQSFRNYPHFAPAVHRVPIVARTSINQALVHDEVTTLNLQTKHVSLDQFDSSFWQAFDRLDEAAWLQQIKDSLQTIGQPVSVAALLRCQAPPKRHDLEAIAFLMALARYVAANFDHAIDYEYVDLIDEQGALWRYRLPKVVLEYPIVAKIQLEDLQN